jgi:hypothetical protein
MLDDSGDVEENMCDQPSGFIHMLLRNCLIQQVA